MAGSAQRRDPYDYLILLFTFVQAVAVAGGVIFAVYELQDRGEAARNAKNEKSRGQVALLRVAVSNSLRPAAKRLEERAKRDNAELTRTRSIGSRQIHLPPYEGFLV